MYIVVLKNNVSVFFADVLELVDMLDLGSNAVRRGGSSPSIRTINNSTKFE